MNTTVIIVACFAMITIVAVTKLIVERTLKMQAIENGKAAKNIALPL